MLGGPANYDGRDLGDAHRGLGITRDHYGKVVSHLVGVLEEMGADRESVEAVATAVASLESDIVEGGSAGVAPGS